MDLVARANLPSVGFSPKAYMGCGGWDLALAPRTTSQTRRRVVDELMPTRQARRATMGCGGGGFPSTPPEIVDTNEEELAGAGRDAGRGCGCSVGVKMGCGDEQCEACAEMGCLKCKRARRKAMMNQDQEMSGSRMGQLSPTTKAVVGLGVAGALLYLTTRL